MYTVFRIILEHNMCFIIARYFHSKHSQYELISVRKNKLDYSECFSSMRCYLLACKQALLIGFNFLMLTVNCLPVVWIKVNLIPSVRLVQKYNAVGNEVRCCSLGLWETVIVGVKDSAFVFGLTTKGRV